MSRRSISLLSSLLFVLLLLTPAILADGEQQFQEFARDVSEEKLHAALHDYNGAKFKHGVFPGDRRALDVIHRERAADASRLVKLAKRQANITTASRSTSSTGSTARPTATPTTIVSTQPSSTSQTSRQPTSTSDSKATTAPSSSSPRKTVLSTSKSTRTVTGAEGVSTVTDVVVATSTDEPSPPPPGETTSPTPSSGTPGLQNVGLRVSGRDSAIVAVLAALCFFML